MKNEKRTKYMFGVRVLLLEAAGQVARDRAADQRRVVHKNEVIETAMLMDPAIVKEYRRLRREKSK